MLSLADLGETPNALARHYGRFRVIERILLTGHSHQAWPDCGLEGQRQAWLDAAEFVDAKWELAFERAERVRRGFARLLGNPAGHIALGGSTHDLLIRFLSALPLRDRPRLVTTDGEFHTIRRQLDRLAEEGIEVVKVGSDPAGEIAGRLAAAVNERTAAVLVSCVLFRDARIVPGLGLAAAACRSVGAELLVDAYHALNVVPFSVQEEGLEDAFVVGGGYKYCQLGEGNCFLRLPAGRKMRPVVTGWFGEFGAALCGAGSASEGHVSYAPGAERFAGSTYDPTSHYRASEVFDFFRRERLTPEFLRELSQHQVGMLARQFDQLDANPELITRRRGVPLVEIAGFLALRCPRANEVSMGLRERGVHTDVRGDTLRLGPAPYLADAQLVTAIEALKDVLDALPR